MQLKTIRVRVDADLYELSLEKEVNVRTRENHMCTVCGKDTRNFAVRYSFRLKTDKTVGMAIYADTDHRDELEFLMAKFQGLIPDEIAAQDDVWTSINQILVKSGIKFRNIEP